jgi:hypothetical protein
MTDVFDQVGRQLREAHCALDPVPAGRTRRRPGVRAVLGAGVAALVLGTTAAATTPWQPILGEGDNGPKSSTTAVPGDQQALLAVLRRPQTDTDRGKDVEQELKLLLAVEDHGVRLDGVRRLADGPTPGTAVVLVPKESFGEDPPGPAGPRVRDALCVNYPRPPVSGPGRALRGSAVSCWTTAQVLAGKAMGIALGRDRFHLYGLVPDGVATVAITGSDGRSARATVSNNFFDIPGPKAAGANRPSPEDTAPQGDIRWLDASGQPIEPRAPTQPK